jgi:mannose-6-phosphate isomerase-like protein (cupin superfamily)
VAERHRSVVRIDEGRPFDALGATVRRLIHPNTVGSKLLGVSICLMEPGDEIRRHRHSYEEAYFVVRGSGAMYLEGEGSIRLEPGLSVYVPPERVHGQVNDGDEPLHIICSLAPPPVEGDPPRFAEEPWP